MANIFNSISKVLEAILEELKEKGQVEYRVNDLQIIRLTIDDFGTIVVERLEKQSGRFVTVDEESWYSVDGLVDYLADVFKRELQKKLIYMLISSVTED